MDNEKKKNPGHIESFDDRARRLAMEAGTKQEDFGSKVRRTAREMGPAGSIDDQVAATQTPVTIGSKLDDLYTGVDILESTVNEFGMKLNPLLPPPDETVAETGIDGKAYEPNSEIVNRLQTLINKVDMATNILLDLKNNVQI